MTKLTLTLKPKRDWFESTGTIAYDPPRPGMKRKTERWCILKVDREITRYFRWWVEKEVLNPLGFDDQKKAVKNGFTKLELPSWNAHVSILRGEYIPPDMVHLWKKHDGKTVKFEYTNHVKKAGNFWVVDVRSDFLKMIRDELKKPSEWLFHLTVGRVYTPNEDWLKD